MSLPTTLRRNRLPSIGEDEQLHAPVLLVGAAADQAPLLEPVGDAGQVRAVAGEGRGDFAHRPRPVQRLQCHQLRGKEVELAAEGHHPRALAA